MFLRFICLCCVTAYIIAAPLKDEVSVERQQPTVIPIISLSAEYVADGKFKYNYETGNGIKREETAYDKESREGKSHSDCSNEGGEDDDSGEIHVQKGSYSYTAPDGTLVSVRYIADENGFQPIITEVSHSGSQLSSDSSQNVKQSDHGKMATDKTIEHFETEHKNNSNEQSTPTISKNIEPKNKDFEEEIPLKFGDKLKKSEKLIKKEPLKQNNLDNKEKVVPAEIPNKGSKKSTNDHIPVDEKERNKMDSIINEEPLSVAGNSVSKIPEPSTTEQISDTKKEIPSKVENKTTDSENEEDVPDEDEKITKNVTEKPSHNKDKPEKNDDASHEDEETSDNKKPNKKIEKSDKLKEDLAPKEGTSLETKNNNSKQKNTTHKDKKPNPKEETKPLETEKNTKEVKSREAVVKPQENKSNIPEKQNKTSEHTEAGNIGAEQGSESILKIPKNKNDALNNLHDLPNNVTVNSQETKNISAKTEKTPLKSEIESAENKNELDSKDQLPEKKKNKPSLVEPIKSVTEEKLMKPKSLEQASGHLGNVSSSLEAEKNSDNSQKNQTKESPEAEGLKDNKNDTSDSIKTKPYKENKELPKEEVKIANETNKPDRNNKTLNYTEGVPETEIKKPHENKNASVESEKEPVKPRIQSPESNNNISNNKETNKDMTNNLFSKKDKSTPKSSGQQIIPKDEATINKKEGFDKTNPSKEMEENKTPNKEENNLLKKNETLKNGENVTNNTEKSASPTKLSNETLTKDILNEVQKPVKEAEKHEKVAEKAAKKATKAAEVAENAADTAQKAAKDTEAILKTLNQTGNHSRELALSAAIKHAKLAGDAAKEAVQAAEMAEIAADNAKNAAQAAEKVVELVQSSSNTKPFKELIDKAGDAVKDAKKSANDAVHAAKDATKQSESLPESELKNIDANLTSNI